MRALHSSLPPKRHLSPEWRQALQLLVSSPRGTTEDMLVLGHGFSSDMLAMLVLAGLATVVTETLRVGGGTFSRSSVCASQTLVVWQFKVDRTQTGRFFQSGGDYARSVNVRLDPGVRTSRRCCSRHDGFAVPTVDVRARQSVRGKGGGQLDHQLRERVL
jgi:hypothetical protein